jgi:hypothetical protein
MHRFEWSGQGGIEFHLGYGDWIRLLRANGFEVLDLIEICAPDGLTELRSDGLVDPDWARKWPAEQIWKARQERRSRLGLAVQRLQFDQPGGCVAQDRRMFRVVCAWLCGPFRPAATLLATVSPRSRT